MLGNDDADSFWPLLFLPKKGAGLARVRSRDRKPQGALEV